MAKYVHDRRPIGGTAGAAAERENQHAAALLQATYEVGLAALARLNRKSATNGGGKYNRVAPLMRDSSSMLRRLIAYVERPLTT